jgi:predicted PurR-regulated permease PerM
VPRTMARPCSAPSPRADLGSSPQPCIGAVVSYLAAVVVPGAVAMLLAALLSPAVHRLRYTAPRRVATALVIVGGLIALGGGLTFVIVTFVRGVPALAAQLPTSIGTIVDC